MMSHGYASLGHTSKMLCRRQFDANAAIADPLGKICISPRLQEILNTNHIAVMSLPYQDVSGDLNHAFVSDACTIDSDASEYSLGRMGRLSKRQIS